MFGIRVVMGSGFASSEHLISRIESANLLEKCSGPYPQDQMAEPLASLKEALDLIIGMDLDATPYSNWDKSIYDALQRSSRALKKRRGFWTGLFTLPRELREREDYLLKLVGEKMEVGSTALGLAGVGKVAVGWHIGELFHVTSLLLDAEQTPDWPQIIRAVEYALAGYLPVDFMEEGSAGRLAIFRGNLIT
jgi:hypothetical protein